MTIKKIIILVSVIIFSSTIVFGKGELSKVEQYQSRKDIYFLDGFSFTDADISTHSIGLEKYVDAEIKDIASRQEIKKRKKENLEYILVGYSEGGLRALAYTKRLKEQKPDEYKNLKAVITVSGIDKGLKALEGGFTPLKAKVQEDINIIYNGLSGFVMGLPIASFLVYVTGGILFDFTKDSIFDFINEISPYLDSYITCAWNGGTYSQLAEIYDMMPNSEFIKNNVAYTEKVTYSVRVGTNYVLGVESKKVLGIRVYYLVLRSEPKYKYYTSYKDKMRIDKNLPIGYIVGTDSNTIGILNDVEDIDINESQIRKFSKLASGAMYIASAANTAKYIASLGILTSFYNAARNCNEAGNWFRSIDWELNELKGSNENDGLVAKESQFYPMRFENKNNNQYEEVHSKVLGNTELGYVTKEFNHYNIDPKTNKDIKNEIFKMIGVTED